MWLTSVSLSNVKSVIASGTLFNFFNRVLGHILLSQIAATINLYIQKKTHSSFEDSEEMFMGLWNQKCIVYSSRIVTNEGQSGAAQYYKKFKIKYPISFNTSGNRLKPDYGIAIGSKEQM
ncbi:hypothetical protein [uncultured Phocaeicola sp.]|uniref:hypothetical protein n=1 Tax=uncultured Phocaeicola sp. TaxID=990718 RepID=UPI0025A093BD|nr:hypothetical protein [uncultured Phocaeicola sp.]